MRGSEAQERLAASARFSRRQTAEKGSKAFTERYSRLKDYCDVILSRVARGAEKALDRLKFDVEQEEIAKRVAEYEARLDQIYEEMLKEESIEKFESEREQARDSLNENWGLDWDEDDYEEFWDTFGDSDLIDTYGSEQLIYIGERFIKERGELRPSKVAKIAKQTMNEISGMGFTQEQAIDRFNRNIEKAIQKRNKKGR